MSVKSVSVAAFGAFLLTSSAAFAWGNGTAQTHGYAGVKNHCPAGLSPVVVNGVICCGEPTSHISYQAMKAQPIYKKLVKRVAKRQKVVHRHQPRRVMTTHTQVYVQPTYSTHVVSDW